MLFFENRVTTISCLVELKDILMYYTYKIHNSHQEGIWASLPAVDVRVDMMITEKSKLIDFTAVFFMILSLGLFIYLAESIFIM